MRANHGIFLKLWSSKCRFYQMFACGDLKLKHHLGRSSASRRAVYQKFYFNSLLLLFFQIKNTVGILGKKTIYRKVLETEYLRSCKTTLLLWLKTNHKEARLQ